MDRQIKLLVVDDDEEFLSNISKRLEKHGLDVTSYNNGFDAMCGAKNKRFDVALLDLELPTMNGGQLLKKLKELDNTIEVIILTGHGTIQSAFELSKEGAYEYLLKPSATEEVLKAISSAYSKRVTARFAEKAGRVDSIMNSAFGLSPIEILEELHKLDKE